jgi:hypothetical protein
MSETCAQEARCEEDYPSIAYWGNVLKSSPGSLTDPYQLADGARIQEGRLTEFRSYGSSGPCELSLRNLIKGLCFARLQPMENYLCAWSMRCMYGYLTSSGLPEKPACTEDRGDDKRGLIP